MRFSVVAAAALAAGASAASTPSGSATPSVVTEVVTAYTTYCPEATSIVHGSSTYVVSTPGQYTITACPGSACTVTRPIYSSTVTYCNSCAGPTAPAGSSSVGANPVYPSSSSSGSSVRATPTPSGPAGTSAAVLPTFTGGASRAAAGAGAGLAGVLGLAAFLL